MQSFISNMRIATTAPQTPINTRYRALYNFKRIYTHRYIYMRFFCARLLLRNTATGYAYCFAIRLRATPIALRAIRLRCYAIAPLPGAIRSAVRLFACGKYASLWATPIALRAIRLRCYAIAPLPGAIRSAVRLFACGKYASQIYTFRSYSKMHQYIAIPNPNVRIIRFIHTK